MAKEIEEKAKEIKEKLSRSQREAFDDIQLGRVLGAGNHIAMILDMFLDVAAGTDFSDEEKQRYVREISQYFTATRGKSSYAIINALKRVERLIAQMQGGQGQDCERQGSEGQGSEGQGVEGFAGRVSRAVAQYQEQSRQDTGLILTYTQRALAKAETVMIYDYSSTVEKALCSMERPLRVIVPESRAIDGGKPFLPALLKTRHQIHFIPDAAMATVLKQVDAVLIGAETYYPDGTAFNTVGSDMLAELCASRNIPYYVLTPTLKCDRRSLEGIYKETIGADLRQRMSGSFEFDSGKIDFYSLELVSIPPKHITAYITEYGIFPPTWVMDLERRR